MEVEVKKSKNPIVLGVVSLVAWFIPIIGLITSTFGIILTVLNGIMGYYLYINYMNNML